MRRLGTCFLIVAGNLAFNQIAAAQQSVKMPILGILRNDTPALFASRNDALRQGLRELGYVEGKNVRLEYRYAESKPERLPQLAAEPIAPPSNSQIFSPVNGAQSGRCGELEAWRGVRGQNSQGYQPC